MKGIDKLMTNKDNNDYRINKVKITGDLVKNTLKECTTKNGDDAISGALVLRTDDGSEHEISFYAKKYDDYTKETTKEYELYLDAIENFKDLEHCETGEKPDVVTIEKARFVDNDFKGKTGDVVSSTKIKAKEFKLISKRTQDSCVKEAVFAVEGIVESIENEIKKNEDTGNLVIVLNAIGQAKKDDVWVADKLIPVKLVVPKELVSDFNALGFYAGCYANFRGSIINKVETITKTTKQALGKDYTETFTDSVTRYEIGSGDEPSTIFDHKLTQEIVDTLIAKRKQKLVEVAQGVDDKSKSAFTPDKSKPAPSSTYNPFAQG